MVFYKSRRGEASYRCQRGQIYEIDARHICNGSSDASVNPG